MRSLALRFPLRGCEAEYRRATRSHRQVADEGLQWQAWLMGRGCNLHRDPSTLPLSDEITPRQNMARLDHRLYFS